MSADRNRFDAVPRTGRPALAIIRKLHEQRRDPAIGHPRRHVPREWKIRPQNMQDDDRRSLGPEPDRGEILGVHDVVLGVRRFDQRRKPKLRDDVSPRRHHRRQLVGKRAGSIRNRSGTDDSSGPGRNPTSPFSAEIVPRLRINNGIRVFISNSIRLAFVPAGRFPGNRA